MDRGRAPTTSPDLRERDLRRDQGPHQGDRPLGADAQPRLVVLRPVLRGPRVRHVVPGRRCRRERLDSPGSRTRTPGRTSPRFPASRCCSTTTPSPRDHDFYSVGGVSVSPDATLLAYSTDTVGDERYVLEVKDLVDRRAAPRPDRGRARRRCVEPRRPRPLLLHRRRLLAPRQGLAAPPRARTDPDELVFHETDERFWVGIGRSRTQRFLVIGERLQEHLGGALPRLRRPGGRVGRLPPARGGAAVRPRARRDRRRGPLPRAPRPRRRRLRARLRADRGHAAVGLARRSSRTTSGSASRTSSAYAGHLVVHQRSGGLTQLRIVELGRRRLGRRLPRGVPAGALHRRRQRRRRSSTQPIVRVDYTSLTVPSSVYDYDVRTRDLTPAQAAAGARPRPRGVRGAPVVGDRRRRRPGPDLAGLPQVGARGEPVRSTRSRSCSTATAPTRSRSTRPSRSSRLSLLDRGAGMADRARPRRRRDGPPLVRRRASCSDKRHTFSDFAACARHLVADRLDHPRPSWSARADRPADC